jgi:DNA-binding cell septation regulator SpoVG
MIEVTNTKLFLSKDQSGANCGYGAVQFNDFLWIDIKVMKTDGRLWISWPSYKKSDGTYQHQVKFLNGDQDASLIAKKAIEEYIISDFVSSFNVMNDVSTKAKSKEPLVSFKKKSTGSFDVKTLIKDDEIVDDEDDEILQQAMYKRQKDK